MFNLAVAGEDFFIIKSSLSVIGKYKIASLELIISNIDCRNGSVVSIADSQSLSPALYSPELRPRNCSSFRHQGTIPEPASPAFYSLSNRLLTPDSERPSPLWLATAFFFSRSMLHV